MSVDYGAFRKHQLCGSSGPDAVHWPASQRSQHDHGRGCSYVEPKLNSIQQRTLLLCSDLDFLLPSREEGPRLKNKLRRCNLRVSYSVQTCLSSGPAHHPAYELHV